MAFLKIAFLLAILFFLRAEGEFHYPSIHDLINEYRECLNSIYIYGKTASLDLPIQVLSIITTNSSLDVPGILSVQTPFPCIAYFILFPEKLTGGYYGKVREKISGEAYVSGSYGINPQIFTHIFTADFSPERVKRANRREDYSYRDTVFHMVLDQDGKNVIASSLLLSGFGDWNYDFRRVETGSNSSLRQSIDEKFREIYKGEKHFYFVALNIFHGVQNVSSVPFISNILGNPFTFKVPRYGMEQIGQLLSAYQLDVWVTVSEITAPGVVQSVIDNFCWTMQFIYTFSNVPVESSVVVTGMPFMNFITCDGVTQPTSFSFYTNPYDHESWYTYAALAFLFIPFLVLVSQISGLQGICAKFKFYSDFFCFNISASLEAGLGIPRAADLGLCTNLLLGTWLILTVVLVNAYKGIVVAELTLPPNTFRNWTSVSQTRGFVYFVPEELVRKLLAQYIKGREQNMDLGILPFRGLRAIFCLPKETLLSLDCGAIRNLQNVTAELATAGITLSELTQGYPGYCNGAESLNSNNSGGRDLSVFERSCYEYSFLIKNRNPQSKSDLVPFVDALVLGPPASPPESRSESYQAYFKEILQAMKTCRRIGFVEKESVLNALTSLAEEDEDPRYFKAGDDQVYKEWEGFYFCGWKRGSQVLYTALQNLLATGIYHVWEKWNSINNPTPAEIFLRKKSTMKATAVFKALQMKTNVSTIFYILLTCLGIALLTFLAERLCSWVCDKVKLAYNLYRVISSFLRQFCRHFVVNKNVRLVRRFSFGKGGNNVSVH